MLQWYESFLLSNASQITAVESSLRSITYFLPGRFPDAELAGEAVYSALNLLGLYHDSILVRLLSPKQLPRSIGASASSKKALNRLRNATPTSITSSGAPAPPATYSKLQHTPSEHARYTHHFSDSSRLYGTLARTLVIIGYTELLAEMVAKRKLGEKRAWDVVISIESIKAVLRLALIRLTDTRPTVQPPIPEREVDPAMLEEDRKAALTGMGVAGPSSTASSSISELDPSGSLSASQHESWRGTRTGLTRPTLQSIRQRAHPDQAAGNNASRVSRPRHPLAASRSAGNSSGSGSGSDSDDTLVDSWTEKDVNDYLLSRTLAPNDVKKPEDLVRQMRNGMGYTAELIWVLRPLLYVLAMRKWGRKHKTPFFLSFGLEYLAGLMRVRALSPPGVAGAPSPLANPLLMAMMGDSAILSLLQRMTGSGAKEARPVSEVERQEWEKRSRAFWWYLLRGPAWHSFTRPKLLALATKTESRPLIGILGGIVRDYLPLVDDYYYYSST